jgi:hypothetical protein
MSVNLSSLATHREKWPTWNQRGRIRKVSKNGDLVPSEFAFNGEVVQISPRYMKNGSNFRVRPERPAAFFAAFCHENELLPTQLTADECDQEWALELLDPLWAANKHRFFKLESPNAACDVGTQPSHRNGFSFCILQVLVEEMGGARTARSAPGTRLFGGGGGTNGQAMEATKRKIEEMRARTGVKPNDTSKAKRA